MSPFVSRCPKCGGDLAHEVDCPDIDVIAPEYRRAASPSTEADGGATRVGDLLPVSAFRVVCAGHGCGAAALVANAGDLRVLGWWEDTEDGYGWICPDCNGLNPAPAFPSLVFDGTTGKVAPASPSPEMQQRERELEDLLRKHVRQAEAAASRVGEPSGVPRYDFNSREEGWWKEGAWVRAADFDRIAAAHVGEGTTGHVRRAEAAAPRVGEPSGVDEAREELDAENAELFAKVEELEEWQREVCEALTCDGDEGPLWAEFALKRIHELRFGSAAHPGAGTTGTGDAEETVAALLFAADLCEDHGSVDDLFTDDFGVANRKRRAALLRALAARAAGSLPPSQTEGR